MDKKYAIQGIIGCVLFGVGDWLLITGAVSMVLPASMFSKGLYTFCMNGGMIVWFIRLLIRPEG